MASHMRGRFRKPTTRRIQCRRKETVHSPPPALSSPRMMGTPSACHQEPWRQERWSSISILVRPLSQGKMSRPLPGQPFHRLHRRLLRHLHRLRAEKTARVAREATTVSTPIGRLKRDSTERQVVILFRLRPRSHRSRILCANEKASAHPRL